MSCTRIAVFSAIENKVGAVVRALAARLNDSADILGITRDSNSHCKMLENIYGGNAIITTKLKLDAMRDYSSEDGASILRDVDVVFANTSNFRRRG